MGRPINKRYFGSGAGNQIQITGDVGSGITAGFIVRQKSTREFIVNLGGNVGRVKLVDNVAPGVGEAYINLFEDGTDSDGSGADFTADLQMATISVSAGGAGTPATTDTLTLAGGTFNTAGTIDVTSITGSAIDGVIVLEGGNYSVLPTSPNTVTTSGSGTGATMNLDTWSIDTATSVSAGTLYDQAPSVVFAGGGGVTQATATAVTDGSTITAVNIDTAGSGYTSVPTISFVNAGRKFVERFKANKVNATDGVQTQWDNTLGATPPTGQSKIDNDA